MRKTGKPAAAPTGRPRLLGPGDIPLVSAALARAERAEDAARMLGVAVNTLRRFATASGLTVPKPKGPKPPGKPDDPRAEDVLRARFLFPGEPDDGRPAVSFTTLGAGLGLSASRVANIQKEGLRRMAEKGAVLTPRPPPPRAHEALRDADPGPILARLGAGEGAAQVAASLGVAQPTLRAWARLHGHVFRPICRPGTGEGALTVAFSKKEKEAVRKAALKSDVSMSDLVRGIVSAAFSAGKKNG
jgi:hypothetical protein